MDAITRFCAVTLLSVSFFACGSVAQQQRPGEQPKWDFGAWFAGATGEEHTNSLAESQLVSAGFFVGTPISGEIGSGWRSGSLEYGLNVVPIVVQLGKAGIHGSGIEPIVLRWNSSRHAGHAVPYIELAGGAVRTNGNFPTGNTSNFNFTARAGGGVQIFTAKRKSLDVGLRWWHISNANLGVENPEFNGIQVSLGYHWLK